MRHRMNRGPNEGGKAGQDYEQSPKDQDPHVCNIRISLPPFKVPSAAAYREERWPSGPVRRRADDGAKVRREGEERPGYGLRGAIAGEETIAAYLAGRHEGLAQQRQRHV